jgi:hypothetical protein
MPWAHGIVQAWQAQGEVAPSPLANGVVATAQIAADLQIGWGVGICRSQDDAGA